MPKIKDSCIEDIRNRVNIYDLVSQYVSLKRSGAHFKGLSPFTVEKTPSFFVYPDRGFYYCFSTSQGGDIFKFVQTKESLNFPEAVEFIANRFGIAIEYEKSSRNESRQNQSLRKQIFDINAESAAWFSELFFRADDLGECARRYWVQERRFSEADAKNLQIGVSPIDWAEFKKKLERKYSFEALAESGLFFKPKSGSSLMQRFRGRLMIPICDTQGRVIGFSARKTPLTPSDMDYEEGKYVNSPETPIFKKNAVLFNFHRARKAVLEAGFFIVVEGQIDALRMYLSGFENTVAGQGTALGENQFNLLARHAKKVVLMLDGDSAGQKAAKRVLPICLKCGLEPSVAIIPPGQDPDSLILNESAAAVQKILDSRLSAVGFLSKVFKDSFKNPSVADKRAVLEEIYTLIDSTDSFVAKDEYLREASQCLGAEHSAVARDYMSRSKAAPAKPEKIEKNSRQVLTNAIYDVLSVCLVYPDIAQSVANIVDTDWFGDASACERLFRRLIFYYRNGENFDISQIEEESEKNLAYEILANSAGEIENPSAIASKCVERIHKNYCKAELDRLSKVMESGEADTQQKREALSKSSQLRKLLRNTKFII